MKHQTFASLVVCLLVLTSTAISRADTDAAPASRPSSNYSFTGPTTEHGLVTYIVTSDYQAKPCRLWVLLPDKFDKSSSYKVLYLLPALMGSDNKQGVGDYYGMLEAKKLDLQNKYNLIIVGPDFSIMPWYGDNPDNPKVRYDSYVPEVVVPIIDKTYPTIARAEGRYLLGFSKSGIGAITLLFHFPEIFGRTAAWDAPLMENDLRPEYYGTMENFKKNYYLPDQAAKVADIFSKQPARIVLTGAGWGSEQKFHDILDNLKIPHYFDPTLAPDHAWQSGWLAPTLSVLMSDDIANSKPVGPLAPKTRPAKTQPAR